MTRSIASRPSCWAPGGSFTEADWRHVGLVTIGGNDARFEPTLAECTFVQCDRGKRAKRIERRVTNTLPSFLALTYAAIARRAPRATVVVLGYPRLFPGPGQAEPRCFANKLPRARQLFLNRVSSRMRDVIARQARRSGFFFLDVAPTFAGHEPCGPKDDWIFGLSRGLDRGVVSVKSYHPNRDGQELRPSAAPLSLLRRHQRRRAACRRPARHPGPRPGRARGLHAVRPSGSLILRRHEPLHVDVIGLTTPSPSL